MNAETPNLQIRVHKLDRSVSSFVQNDLEAVKQFLRGFDPTKIFNQPRIIIGNRNSRTVILVPQITRIDLEMNSDSPLNFLTDLVEGVELLPAEFAAMVQSFAADNQSDAFAMTFLDLEMADARNVLLTIDAGSASPQGVHGLRDFLLSRSGLCFRASSGSVSVLNLANLSCLTIFPGAPRSQDDVWRPSDVGKTGTMHPKKFMKLSEFKKILSKSTSRNIRFILPTGSKIPPHAHVTEVARIDKRYIDCGGTQRTDTVCRLQTWFQDDTDHRLRAEKLSAILEKSASFFDKEDPDVDVEHEAPFISHFPVEKIETDGDVLMVHLGVKHTACLAEDRCLPPSLNKPYEFKISPKGKEKKCCC